MRWVQCAYDHFIVHGEYIDKFELKCILDATSSFIWDAWHKNYLWKIRILNAVKGKTRNHFPQIVSTAIKLSVKSENA